MKLISLVFSFRNEEKNLSTLVERIESSLSSLNNWNYELIFVNDFFYQYEQITLDYFEIIEESSFSLVNSVIKNKMYRMMIAFKVGDVRLIDNLKLKPFTLNAITAASKIDGDVHVLVAGAGCDNVSKEIAGIPLVKKVLVCDSQNYQNYLPENLAPLVAKISE